MSVSIQELLFEMDRLDKDDKIIFLATAVSTDNILKEFLKPKRFEKIISLSKPTKLERKAILEYYLAKIKHDDSVNVDILSRYLSDKTGNEIKDVINKSAIKAAMNNKSSVSMQLIEETVDNVEDGLEAKSIKRTTKCKQMTAYHEAGHALIRHYSKDGPPIYKATIVDRDSSTGQVLSFSRTDTEYHETKSELVVDIDIKLAGRGAEELIYGKDQVRTGE